MNNNPAGLRSRIRLEPRVMPSELGHAVRRSATALPWQRCQPSRLYKEGQRLCGGQQRIVDQAKAQGNDWDTGVVPGHRKMELNSTIAEEVKNHVLSAEL